MRYGRPTNDPKGETVRVRLNGEMKEWLSRKADRENKSISEIIRGMVSENMICDKLEKSQSQKNKKSKKEV